ncbi:MAG: hypothetical protein LUD29_05920 [Clostridia bacterium]|nr:hypothetical protein [Clostridia bacterium]
MKKRILAAAAASLMAVGAVGMAACGGNGKKTEGLTEEEAAAMIETFTDLPSSVEGRFVQDFTLVVDSDNASFRSFAKDLVSTVDFAVSFMAGDIYMYAKKTVIDRADGNSESVSESILAKEDGTYSYATTEKPRTALSDGSDSGAVTEADRLFRAATTETSGWLDLSAFVYSGFGWVQDYIMLGSSSVQASNSRYFTYLYEKNSSGGLDVSVDTKYVGYTGDAGVVDVGTDENYTGGSAKISTNEKGFITSFSQKMLNQIDFNITTPPVPLYYTGERTLSASYDGNVVKKNLSDVNVETGGVEAATSTVTMYENSKCEKIETYDFAYPDYSTLDFATDVVTAGNYVAVKVTPKVGYEVAKVLVNGKDTTLMNGYFCLMEKAEGGTTYNVAVTMKPAGEETGDKGSIVSPEAKDIDGVLDITVGDFDLATFITEPGAEVEPGHYVTVMLTCEEGYLVTKVTVNGEETKLFGNQYCYMSPVVAGAEYVVEVEVSGYVFVTFEPVNGCDVGIYDFNLAAFSGLDKTSETVRVGNWVAVLVTCKEGFAVDTVMVYVGDSGEGIDITKANFGTAYCLYEVKADMVGLAVRVVVTLKAHD